MDFKNSNKQKKKIKLERDQLKAFVDVQQNQIRHLTKEIMDLKSENQELQNKSKNREREIMDLKSENQELKNKIKDSERENLDLKSESQELQNKLKDRDREISELKSENHDLKNKTKDREREILDLKSENQDLKGKTKDRERDILDLKSENQEVKNKLKDYNQPQNNDDITQQLEIYLEQNTQYLETIKKLKAQQLQQQQLIIQLQQQQTQEEDSVTFSDDIEKTKKNNRKSHRVLRKKTKRGSVDSSQIPPPRILEKTKTSRMKRKHTKSKSASPTPSSIEDHIPLIANNVSQNHPIFPHKTLKILPTEKGNTSKIEHSSDTSISPVAEPQNTGRSSIHNSFDNKPSLSDSRPRAPSNNKPIDKTPTHTPTLETSTTDLDLLINELGNAVTNGYNYLYSEKPH
jgi:myosin heavy subunit